MHDDRVTNAQLYQELSRIRDEVPSRRELRLTVIVGNIAGAAVLSFTSQTFRLGPRTVEAASAVLAYLS